MRSSSGTTLHWPARYVALYFQWLTLPGSGCVLKFCENGQLADCQFAVGQRAVSQEFVRFVSCPLRSSRFEATLHWPARYVALYFQQLTVPGSGWVLEFFENGQLAVGQLP